MPKPQAKQAKRGLWSVSFVALLVTQFLVALNDNMFRWLIIPIGKELVGQDVALTAGSVIFLLPFVLLAAPAGYLTDRFSKRTVMIGCKVAEIAIMLLGIVVILTGNIFLMMLVLFLMGAQSTMFSPSKYGSIPEMVDEDCISSANGLIGMTTMVAIILGVVAGGWLYDVTTPPSVLIVDEDGPERELLGERIGSLGFRVKKVDSIEGALESIRNGTPKLVVVDDPLGGPGSVAAAVEIHEVAGTVAVVLASGDAELRDTALAADRGPNLCLAKPIEVGRLKAAVFELAGRGEPAVARGAMLPGQLAWWRSALALVGVAVVGWFASLFIGRLPAANAQRRFPINPFRQTFRDLGELVRRRPLLAAASASAFFWSLGLLTQLNVDKFARPELVTDQRYIGPLLGVLTLGIGLGSVLAGILSRGKIELGLVPIGAFGMAIFSMLLFTVPEGVGSPFSGPYYWACFWLAALGLSAGLYDIPLLAFLQHRSPEESRGRILAAYNFLSFSGMLLASGIFWLFATQMRLSGRTIWLVAGLATLPVCFYAAWHVFHRVAWVIVGNVFRVFYRVRLSGLENIPRESGALLLPNHISWIDGLLLVLYSPRPVRIVAHEDYFRGRIFGRLARDFGVIPIVPGGRSVIRSLRVAREAIGQGDLVCLFPEGGLTRTGQINPFQSGYRAVLKGTGAPIIPVCLGGLWGSVFSFERGKYFWKWPRRVPFSVSIRFGRPLPTASEPHEVRRRVQELEIESREQDQRPAPIPARNFLRMCRRNLRRPKVADSLGTRLSGSRLLMRTLILRRLLRRSVLAGDERCVGVLLPPSVAGVVANAALSVDGRVAVNLNYTLSSELINRCIDQAGVRHVLSSRKVSEKLGLSIEADFIYLEDLREKVTWLDKLVAACSTWLLPAWLLERRLGLTRIASDDLLTVIFTSGSTGDPKGVMLTHDNIGSNVAAFSQILHLVRGDVLVGILPFFHSFGYTTTLWSVLSLDPQGIYHTSPLEPRPIGKLCGEHGATILITTPTFLRSYVRRCEPEDFRALEVVVCGAEKLPAELADAFERRFGVRPVEGYGTTELSPVVSCNIPPRRDRTEFVVGHREGTVGKPIPGVAAKVVDLETGEDLGIDESGMLLIRGHNVMKGYLHQAERTAEAIRDGWYATGDVAMLDEEGFIHITGRESRFSKIGGEMVPHLHIEAVLGKVLALDDEVLCVAVTAVADVRKGERIVVLHTKLGKRADEICRDLAEAGLPPLWIPSPESFCEVDEIPILGTGKLDLGQLKRLALERFPDRRHT